MHAEYLHSLLSHNTIEPVHWEIGQSPIDEQPVALTGTADIDIIDIIDMIDNDTIDRIDIADNIDTAIIVWSIVIECTIVRLLLFVFISLFRI